MIAKIVTSQSIVGLVQAFLHMVHQLKSISTIGFRVELKKSLELILTIIINPFKSKTTVIKK